jgi:hypothetical protein
VRYQIPKIKYQKLAVFLSLTFYFVAFAQSSFQAELQTKVHLRTNALDSAAISWFQTRADLSFIPVKSRNFDSKIGFELRANGFPKLTSANQLDQPSLFEPIDILLGEAYFRVYDAIPGLTLTAGRQLVHWGTADAINPTNNIVAPDYSDPTIWDAKRPAWLIDADYNPISSFGFELIAKPIFEPALTTPKSWFWIENLPTTEQLRQGLITSFINQGLDSLTAKMIASNYTITINEDFQMPKNTLKNMSFGGKIKTHFSVFDMSGSLFRGYDFLPYVIPITTINPKTNTLDFVAQERYPRKTVIGGDIAGNLFDIGVWAEATYSIYDDSLPKDKLAFIAGADYSFKGFYANLQFLYGQFPLVMTQLDSDLNFVLGALERKFFDDRLLLRASGIVDVTNGSFGFLPVVRWMPVNGAEIEIGGLVFGGKEGSAFKPLENIKEIFFGVRYQF